MRAASILLAVVLAVVGIGYYFTSVDSIKNHMKLGLDLQGGVYMVLQGVDSEVGPVTPAALDAAAKVIEKRVNSLGVSEPVIQRDSKNRIIVQLAGVMDTEKAREMLGKTAVLKFVDPQGTTVLDGKDVSKAGVSVQNSNNFVVTLQLKGDGPKKFEEATTRLSQSTTEEGKRLAIMLDEDVISAPAVRQPISGDSAIIEGGFTAVSAQKLADLINGGALPVRLELKETRVVTATLGADSLSKSAKAGMFGMLFVVGFMLLLYRVPGMMANIALAIYGIITVGFLLAINAVFTLPGLAGLLLSIGMAVDANVIIFERIKEEIGNGKGLRSGIDAGFHRAYSAVIDSNVTTAIAGAILWYFGTGPVKGFALTLVVGVALSLVTAITVTRWLINLCVATGWFGRSLFGVKEVAK